VADFGIILATVSLILGHCAAPRLRFSEAEHLFWRARLSLTSQATAKGDFVQVDRKRCIKKSDRRGIRTANRSSASRFSLMY